MTEKHNKICRAWEKRLKEKAYKRILDHYKMKELDCFVCHKPLKQKKNCTKEEIKNLDYAVIEHKLEGKYRTNNLHGDKLYQCILKASDEELDQYQIIHMNENWLKKSAYESYKKFIKIGDLRTAENAFKLYCKYANLTTTKAKAMMAEIDYNKR